MMRKRLFLILGLLYTFQMLSAISWTYDGNILTSKIYDESWYTGDKDVYEISTPEQLGGLARQVVRGNLFEDITIILTADIDLSRGIWPSMDDFKGTFDGNGYVIRGLVQSGYTGGTSIAGNTYCKGLFKTLSGTVKNLIVMGEVGADSNDRNTVVAGGVVATLNQGIVENCAYIGTITGTKSNATLGGIVGINNEGTISNSYFYGNTSFSNGTVFGAIAAESTGIISDCYYRIDREGEEKDLIWNFDSDEYLVEGIADGEYLPATPFNIVNNFYIFPQQEEEVKFELTKPIKADSPSAIATTGALILGGSGNAFFINDISGTIKAGKK